MTELIKISDHNGRKLVNARELHQFLESKQDFSTWIKNRIEKYGFVENQDYIRFHKKMEGNNATLIEYGLTIDMAKELSMVENNEKGRTARRYFIAKEKEANNKVIDFTDANSVLQLAQNWAEEQKKREIAEERLKLQTKELKVVTPKAKYYDEVLQSESTYTTTQIAKEFGMGATSLNRKLHEFKVQYKQSNTWLLYQKYQDKGYTKTRTYTYGEGEDIKTNMQTVWTEKGRLFIHSLLKLNA